jgi:hypothetical protein
MFASVLQGMPFLLQTEDMRQGRRSGFSQLSGEPAANCRAAPRFSAHTSRKSPQAPLQIGLDVMDLAEYAWRLAWSSTYSDIGI